MIPKAPEDYVPATGQAHAQGLLLIWEAAKLLDMEILDLVDAWGAGDIEITARCNNLPCLSPAGHRAYRRSRHAQAS